MNRKKLMALLAAGIFSVVSINPTAVLAESAETESTTGEALLFLPVKPLSQTATVQMDR